MVLHETDGSTKIAEGRSNPSTILIMGWRGRRGGKVVDIGRAESTWNGPSTVHQNDT